MVDETSGMSSGSSPSEEIKVEHRDISESEERAPQAALCCKGEADAGSGTGIPTLRRGDVVSFQKKNKNKKQEIGWKPFTLLGKRDNGGLIFYVKQYGQAGRVMLADDSELLSSVAQVWSNAADPVLQKQKQDCKVDDEDLDHTRTLPGPGNSQLVLKAEDLVDVLFDDGREAKWWGPGKVLLASSSTIVIDWAMPQVPDFLQEWGILCYPSSRFLNTTHAVLRPHEPRNDYCEEVMTCGQALVFWSGDKQTRDSDSNAGGTPLNLKRARESGSEANWRSSKWARSSDGGAGGSWRADYREDSRDSDSSSEPEGGYEEGTAMPEWSHPKMKILKERAVREGNTDLLDFLQESTNEIKRRGDVADENAMLRNKAEKSLRESNAQKEQLKQSLSDEVAEKKRIQRSLDTAIADKSASLHEEIRALKDSLKAMEDRAEQEKRDLLRRVEQDQAEELRAVRERQTALLDNLVRHSVEPPPPSHAS